MATKRIQKCTGIGAQLLRIRRTLELVPEDISRKTRIPVSTLLEYERGLKMPSGKYLRFLSVNYNVNMNFIFYRDQQMFRHRNESGPADFGKYDKDINRILWLMWRYPKKIPGILSFIDLFVRKKKQNNKHKTVYH
jgi:transcriptional regulator with XRE-family HTH domain